MDFDISELWQRELSCFSDQKPGFILTSAKIFQFLPVTCRVSRRHATGRKENLTAREYILELLIIPNGPCSVPWDLELPIEFEEEDDEEDEE